MNIKQILKRIYNYIYNVINKILFFQFFYNILK